MGKPERAIGVRNEGCLVWTVLVLTLQLAKLLKVASRHRGAGGTWWTEWMELTHLV